jgi:antirestriction protein ArdC
MPLKKEKRESLKSQKALQEKVFLKENTMTTAQDKLNQTVERLIEKIEQNNAQWIKPFNASFPENYKSNTSYSGLNILNLWMEAEEKQYKTNLWLTFNQVRELKGQVKKGEVSTPIFFFKPIKKLIENEESGEREEVTIPLLKMYYVFNIDQTTLKAPEQQKEEIADIESFISSYGIAIKQSNQGAFYLPSEDYIGIPNQKDFLSKELYYATLFHEIAHSTGHESRCNRDLSGSMRGGEDKLKSYAKEELIAETTRAFLQVHFGLNTTEMEEQNAAYLKSWLKPPQDDPKMLWQIFSQAQKAFNFLLEATKINEKAA